MVHLWETQRALEDAGVQTRLVPRVTDLNGIDVAHLFNLTVGDLSPYVEALERCRAAGIPVVLSSIYYPILERHLYHSSCWLEPKWRWVDRLLGSRAGFALWKKRTLDSPSYQKLFQDQQRLLREADRIFAMTETELGWLEQSFPEVRGIQERGRLIPVGVDLQTFDPGKAQPQLAWEKVGTKEFVLVVSRFTPIKNQYNILRGLMEDPWTLVFIGDKGYESYYNACQRLAAKRKARTIFLDSLPHSGLRDFYSAARAHVLASWRESTGLVAMEAGAMGCALVVSDRLPAREIYGNFAHICDPSDPKSIQKAVLKAREGARGGFRRIIEEKFTWKLAAKRLINEYEASISAARH
jgi:glycosyltransferase involved in cell wall biosynthesis